jgi:TolB-like protein
VADVLESGREDSHPTARRETNSIAVLPFVDMSPNGDQEHISDGLTEELIHALANVEGLRVVARTSAFQFKRLNLDIRKIGEQLGVRTVLEGSVRKDGARLRITAQLNNASDGCHLWSEVYDREMKDVFVLQREIARAVASTLMLEPDRTLYATTVQHYKTDLDAYNLYLKGRYFSEQSNARRLRKKHCIVRRGDRQISEVCACVCGPGGVLLPSWLELQQSASQGSLSESNRSRREST